MSIPLYQQTKTKEYMYEEVFEKNTTSYEQETLANQFNPALFASSESATQNILKATFNAKAGDMDNVTITAYGFKKVKHIEMVPKMGGDGRMHSVPVEWCEYLPVSKQTPMVVTEKESTRSGFNNLINSPQFKTLKSKLGNFRFERGLFAYVGTKATLADAKNVAQAFGEKATNKLEETLVKIDAAVKKGLEAEKKLQKEQGSNDKK